MLGNTKKLPISLIALAIAANAGAQEVEEIVPNVVSVKADGYRAVDYSRMSVVLIGAMQTLIERVEELEAKHSNGKTTYTTTTTVSNE